MQFKMMLSTGFISWCIIRVQIAEPTITNRTEDLLIPAPSMRKAAGMSDKYPIIEFECLIEFLMYTYFEMRELKQQENGKW